MEKKYVPAGVFLSCDKGVTPSTLSVTFNANTVIYGQNMATEADKIPLVNVKPMGVCAITKGPCMPAPIMWSPVQNDVVLGNQRLLLEDSKLQCSLGGRISIFFSMAAAMAAAAPAPAPEKSLLDQADDYLATLGPAGDYARFQMGMAEGLYAGGKSMVEGLWGLAKGGWHVATHPIESAQAVGNAASSAAEWASKGENWSNAASAAGDGISSATDWASHGENWGKAWEGASDWASKQSPRDWGKIGGRVTFEVALIVGTAGAGEAVNVAGKAGEAANLLGKAGEAANLTEKGLEAANLAEKAAELSNAAGKAKVVGKVTTGAEEAADAARAAKAAEEAAAAEKAAKELEAVKGAAKDKRTCKVDPVDVANGVMLFDNLDVELPGPIPFLWERTWYSNSEHKGMLGHGWHHPYDLALWHSPEGPVACRLADGRLAMFDLLSEANDFYAFNRKEKLELRQTETSYLLYDLSSRLYYSFAPTAQRADHYQLTAVSNASGFAIRFRYNEHDHLRAIIDSAGRELRLQTDTAGRILTLELPHPTATGQYFTAVQYHYDEVGNLTDATDALGQRLEYGYQDHLMVQKKFRNGMSFYFEYDGTDSTAKCVRSWGDSNLLNGRFTYEPGHTIFTSDLPGDRSEYFHHNGLVTAHLDPVGALREWHYNEFDELELERDPLGYATAYDYDSRGHLAGVTAPDGTQVQTHYEQDLPVEAIDAMGNHWRWRYNEERNLAARIDPDGIVTRYGYQDGLLHKVSVAGGPPTLIDYDADYNLQEVRQPEGQRSAWQHDALGRVIALTDARGNTQQRAYDLLSRLRRIQEPDGNVRTLTYDAEDNVVRAQDVHQDVVLEYTGLDWLVARTQAGTQVQYRYDTAGQLTQLINEHGRSTTFERDAAGQVVAETRFDGQQRRYELDAAGQVITQWVGEQATNYTYDPLGRITHTTFSDGSQEQFTFRPDGALLSAVNGHAAVSWERDARGRILHETQGAHTVSSRYDRAGRRTGLSSTLGAAVDFEFDQYGEVQRMQADGWQAHFERDAQGLETQRTLSGGVQARWQRDRLGRPVSQVLSVGRSRRQRQYEWHSNDLLGQLTDSATGTTRFAHDALGALIATQYPDGTQELRLPDAVGNLFQTSERQDRTYSPGGQLKEANGTRYRYDKQGNLIRKKAADGQTWQYEWNGAGQLARVIRPDGYAVTFTYDALGRRISKRFRGKVTHWVWDGHKPLHEWSELEVSPGHHTADDLITWLFEENTFAPLAKLAGGQRYSILTDHLGTPLEMVDAQGRSTWSAELNSYGGVRALAGPRTACPFRYQGQYEDAETGLYYNRFRYYDPEAGQYLSQDPIGLLGGWAPYAYVPDPTAWVDPYGLAKCGADDGFRKGWDKERVLKRPKYKRVKTESYLKKRFTDNHLQQFNGEASYLVTGETYTNRIKGAAEVGRTDGLYMSTKTEIDGIVGRANGDIASIEKELGIPGGNWQGKDGIYQITVKNPEKFNLRMPSGNEAAADVTEWMPGGFTSGGIPEAVTDPIPLSHIIAKRIIP